MGNKTRVQTRLALGIVIVACALLGACTRATAPVGPKFSGRLLLLGGGDTAGSDLLEFSAAPGTPNNHSLATLAKGVFEAAASPDRTRLLYTTKDEIVLRDLRSGAVKSLVKGENYCLAWSPDGKRFSYKQKSTANGQALISTAPTKLYVSDLEGKVKLIWEDSVEGAVNSPNQSAALERTAGSFGCAHWIAPDRFIFDRFVGMLPKQTKGAEAPKPNTTTLAILGDTVKLSDKERKWSIESICQAGPGAFLRPHDQAQPILIARSLDNLDTLNPTPAPCSGCRFAGFAAQSCVPFFIEDATSTSSELFYLNPTNWQRQRGAHIGQTFSVTAKMLINSAAKLMIVGDVPASLSLVDTETGEVTVLSNKSPGSEPEILSPRPVVWIEN